MKKFFLLIGILLIFIISCSDTKKSYEVEMSGEEINWPFEDIEPVKWCVSATSFPNTVEPDVTTVVLCDTI